MASPKLVHNHLLPREERMGCKDSYEPVPRTYKSLGWPNKTSSQRGFRDPMLQQHLYSGDLSHEEHSSLESKPQTNTRHRYNSQGALKSYSSKTCLTTRRRILLGWLNPHHTPKMHTKISPSCYHIISTLSAPSALATNKQSSNKHHIIDIMHSRSK